MNRIERIGSLTGNATSAPGFKQPQVVESASALLIELFGRDG